uniref:Beta-glucuronidase n=1 Tax=Romanomermis culicivorax TaxID=13658 RepID=A0A915HVB2_ROMCU
MALIPLVGSVLTLRCVQGLLYPQDSETRQMKSLDGLWTFVPETPNSDGVGFKEKWWNLDLALFRNASKIPVPSSFNDLTASKALRDHVGWVWYRTTFFAPKYWLTSTDKIFLRFGSVNYFASVNNLCEYTLIENFLSYSYPNGSFAQILNFDFFNYAGILRSVILYTVPQVYISDVRLSTSISDVDGMVSYKIIVTGPKPNPNIKVAIQRRNGVSVAFGTGPDNTIIVRKARFWWPRGENRTQGDGYMYIFQVSIVDQQGQIVDVYRINFGIRTIRMQNGQLYINGKRIYLKGCGMHEDFHVTSHYPYDEQRLDEADRRGFIVIAETPAVGLSWYSDEVLNLHQTMLFEMIDRDKNHPSIIAWSLANEPYNTYKTAARNHFKSIASLAKTLDPTRFITVVNGFRNASLDGTAKFVDFISLNRYYGWYSDNGRSDLIQYQLSKNLKWWYSLYQKPILVTEYGAGAVAGIRQEPSTTFTENYQLEMMSENQKVFDEFKNEFLIGEMFWNFADFATCQSTTRVSGNKKGIFTRDRQPKLAAYLVKKRYENDKQ